MLALYTHNAIKYIFQTTFKKLIIFRITYLCLFFKKTTTTIHSLLPLANIQL